MLHGINLEIREGTVNALVGPSGSGKSTIARLVASLWDVSGGSITLGGVDIRKLTQEDYHRYIAYVSQDNFFLIPQLWKISAWASRTPPMLR